MRENIFIIFICALALSFTSIAYSADGIYAGVGFGSAIANDADLTEPLATGTVDFDPGLAIKLAVGYGFENTRLEGEISYQSNDFNGISVNAPGIGSATAPIDGDGNNLSFLINGYYDFKNKTRVTPFIGAGFGMARVDVSAISIPGAGVVTENADDTVFAYQVGTGVGIKMTEKVSLDISYRYFASADPNFGGTEAENSAHNVFAGIRIFF